MSIKMQTDFIDWQDRNIDRLREEFADEKQEEFDRFCIDKFQTEHEGE